jgi:hypothetical protein
MRLKCIFAALVVAGFSTASQADLFGAFRLTAAGQTTNSAIYPGVFDTYVFELFNSESAGPVTTLEVDFIGNFLNTAPPNNVRNEPENPVVFGFVAPETFALIPDGASPLVGSSIDTNARLYVAYTTQGGLPIVPNDGSPTAIAFLSVPAGTVLYRTNLAPSVGVVGGARVDINTVFPEPATLTLAGLALVGLVGLARRK